jgi:hypothetical protein
VQPFWIGCVFFDSPLLGGWVQFRQNQTVLDLEYDVIKSYFAWLSLKRARLTKEEGERMVDKLRLIAACSYCVRLPPAATASDCRLHLQRLFHMHSTLEMLS